MTQAQGSGSATDASLVSPSPPADPGPEPTLRCPRCGSALRTGQDWCLNCGAAATTTILPPPNWKIPVLAAVLVLLLVIALGVITALQVLDTGTPVPAPTPTPATAVPVPPAAG